MQGYEEKMVGNGQKLGREVKKEAMAMGEDEVIKKVEEIVEGEDGTGKIKI